MKSNKDRFGSDLPARQDKMLLIPPVTLTFHKLLIMTRRFNFLNLSEISCGQKKQVNLTPSSTVPVCLPLSHPSSSPPFPVRAHEAPAHTHTHTHCNVHIHTCKTHKVSLKQTQQGNCVNHSDVVGFCLHNESTQP